MQTPQRPYPDDPDTVLASPYGPQPYGTDSSAGGADSSPLETETTDQRKSVAEDEAGKQLTLPENS